MPCPTHDNDNQTAISRFSPKSFRSLTPILCPAFGKRTAISSSNGIPGVFMTVYRIDIFILALLLLTIPCTALKASSLGDLEALTSKAKTLDEFLSNKKLLAQYREAL